MRTIEPPPFATRGTSETHSQYAIRILLYVIAHDCTAPFSIDDLELALMRAAYHPTMLPTTIDAIRNVRGVLDSAIRCRRRELAATEPPPAPMQAPPPPPAIIGPMAPVPVPPAPIAPRPPVQRVSINF